MNKIIFFVLALVVLIGIGVGGWIMFGQKMVAEAANKSEEAPVKKKKVAEGPPSFVTVGPIVLPVMGETRIEQTVMVMVALECADEETRNTVRGVSPRLLDAYLRALYGKIGKSQVAEGQIVDVGSVKDKLTEATIQVLGPDVVDNVLIQAVSQRPAF
jgi:flagellar FliL protein